MSWSRTPVFALLCLPLVAVIGGCSSSAAAQVKTNGCTAVTSGTVQGRRVVTYEDATGDPAMSSAVAAAVAAWNSAAVPVRLQPVKGGATVTILASTGPTETTRCMPADKVRTSVITLGSRAWHGTGGKALVRHPERDVALELGHALGLTDAGDCTALMTKRKDCPTYSSGPDANEIAEVRKLYLASATH